MWLLKDEQSYFASIKTQLKAQKLSFRERNSQKTETSESGGEVVPIFFVNQCHCNVKTLILRSNCNFTGRLGRFLTVIAQFVVDM